MKEYRLSLEADAVANLPLVEENGHIALSRETNLLSEQTAQLGIRTSN